MRHLLLQIVLCIFLQSASAVASQSPGNVYVVGEAVHVAVPPAWGTWTAVDVEGKEVAHGDAMGGIAELDKLPIGYFEVRPDTSGGRITAAVLAEITASDDTPIALDAAMAWFYNDPQQIRDACALCRLAGVKWVRDRASWPELQPARGTWAGDSRYERALRIEHEAGLKVLQVNHASPPWANKDGRRFPQDLRDVYHFYRGLAQRWKGLADAIEPWNEPDIDVFGGHTGCEIASFQKAAYLGSKAGNPELPVNEAVFAIDRAETLDEFVGNDVYPYFDRYDLHHYVRLAEYPRAYGRHRAVSGGRPMWTTEFNLTIWWADEKTKEPSEEDLRVQGYRVGKVFAEALHEGPEKLFYFILGHYVEGKLQYGLVHQDLTPRPAYVAFAAVGRLLNAARPIGKIDLGDEKLKGYAFATQVDGQPRETLVLWSETKPTSVEIAGADKAYDYLGRALPQANKHELTRSTIFVVLPPGGCKQLKMQPPPEKPKWRKGSTCPVVLQLIGHGDVKNSAFVLDQSGELKLVAYNFGESPAHGTLKVDGGTISAAEITIAPGAREERIIRATAPGKVIARLNVDQPESAIVSANVIPPPPATQAK